MDIESYQPQLNPERVILRQEEFIQVEKDEFHNISPLLADLVLSRHELSDNVSVPFFHVWHFLHYHSRMNMKAAIPYTDLTYALLQLSESEGERLNVLQPRLVAKYDTLNHALFKNGHMLHRALGGIFTFDPIDQIQMSLNRPIEDYNYSFEENKSFRLEEIMHHNSSYSYLEDITNTFNEELLKSWKEQGDEVLLSNCFEQYLRHYKAIYILCNKLNKIDSRILPIIESTEERTFNYIKNKYKDKKDYQKEFVKKFISRFSFRII